MWKICRKRETTYAVWGRLLHNLPLLFGVQHSFEWHSERDVVIWLWHCVAGFVSPRLFPRLPLEGVCVGLGASA